MNEPVTAAASPLEPRVRDLFARKHGSVERMGWGPRLYQQFGYFSPDDFYEAAVESLVNAETEWLDVGGGSDIFPNNPKLAQTLASRCKRLAAVDPSDNVLENRFAHERYQSFLEDFDGQPGRFTLATARMVVEHVARPEAFVAKLAQLMKPGGRTVVYTVNRWAPMTVLSGLTPIGVHHAVKKLLWRTEEKDTFPVEYKMNTRSTLKGLFTAAGFREHRFHRLDDCRTLARWKATLTSELMLRKALRVAGLGYPESCLLGVYERER
jgi:2-polyprenyl-3-methyl-5-hydroxy-6-metoxy-1,4-benzoquinol methylase